jgi:hypothetical protein
LTISVNARPKKKKKEKKRKKKKIEEEINDLTAMHIIGIICAVRLGKARQPKMAKQPPNKQSRK